jgi:hypothetical protein
MKTIFCVNSFQEWSSITNGLRVFSGSKKNNSFIDYRALTYLASNQSFRSNGLKTVFFRNSGLVNFDSISFDGVVDIPSAYENNMSPHAYFSGLKMLIFSSTKEPFIFNNGSVILKGLRHAFKTQILEPEHPAIFSHKLPEINMDLNKKILDFWNPIFPESFEYSSDETYHSYDLSFFACHHFEIVNEVASEIYKFLMERAVDITSIYATQRLEDFNPQISYFIESILFPNMLIKKIKNMHFTMCAQKDFERITANVQKANSVRYKNQDFIIDKKMCDGFRQHISNAFGVKIKNEFEVGEWHRDMEEISGSQ